VAVVQVGCRPREAEPVLDPHYPIDSRDRFDEDRDEAAALAASLAAQVGTE